VFDESLEIKYGMILSRLEENWIFIDGNFDALYPEKEKI
tara:strand:- start:53 stop:169 length:117 start_codon:yes stop_codon:yes gene_type:complete